MSTRCVFTKTDIRTSLKYLETEYKKVYSSRSVVPKNLRLMRLYSKISVITLGGWIEDGMKELAIISNNKINDTSNRDVLEKKYHKYIYGFSYQGHLFKRLVYIFGIHGVEVIEKEVGNTDIVILSSALGNIKTWRDDASHSHISRISCNPTRVLQEFNTIFPILKKIEKSAKKYLKKIK